MISDNGPLPEDYLKCIEEYLGFMFPRGYRDFILKHNGGKFKKNIFDFKENSCDGSIVNFLFGFKSGRYMNVLLQFRDYQYRVPFNTFPIGSDPGGNLILISIRGPDRGKIYFWDHEMEVEEGEEPDYSNLTLINDSFDEFVSNLRDYTEEELREIEEMALNNPNSS